MSDIFICYSKADASIASQLAKHLQKEGWSVFIDRKTTVGRRWHREIEKELRAAKAVVVLWSENHVKVTMCWMKRNMASVKTFFFPQL